MAIEIEPRMHPWTREEYYRMGEAGLLAGRNVELIAGQVIERAPISGPHAAVTLAGEVLREAFGAGYFVRVQNPLDLGALSQPQPDVAVIPGRARDYVQHPGTAALVLEVADSSLAYDRTTKASLYARGGIAEYWILNLVDRQLEVYGRPGPDAAAPFGAGYAERTVNDATASVTPLARPGSTIAVADLLP